MRRTFEIIGNSFKMAMQELWKNKLRTFLSLFGITIGIFCAGTPSSQGTLDLLEKQGIDPRTVEEIRYRGNGWPGKFSVKIKGEAAPREVAADQQS